MQRNSSEAKPGGWWARLLMMLLARILEVSVGLTSYSTRTSMIFFAFSEVSKWSVGVPIR